MQKTKTSTENQPMPPPSSFHHHIISLTGSPMLECFLYTSCSSKDQNSEANKKSQEMRPTDSICRLYHGTRQTWTPMLPRSIRKTHHLASKRIPEPPQHTRDPPLPPPALPVQVQRAQICFHLRGIGIYPIYKSTYPHREHILLQRHVNTIRHLAQWWRWSIPCSGSWVWLLGLMVFFSLNLLNLGGNKWHASCRDPQVGLRWRKVP